MSPESHLVWKKLGSTTIPWRGFILILITNYSYPLGWDLLGSQAQDPCAANFPKRWTNVAKQRPGLLTTFI